MSASSGLRDLLAFSVQGVILAVVAAALSRLLPIDRPAWRLAWWQAVLFASLVLPLVGVSLGLPGRVDLKWEIAQDTTRLAETVGEGVPWSLVGAVVLAFGLLVRLARLVRGAARLRSCRRRATAFDATELRGLEEAVGARADIRLSPDVAVPATFGLRRPLVLLPESVRQMSSEQQRAIIAHELVHVRRRDWLTTVFEEALSAVLWFHPAVAFLLGRIRLAREQCVDAAVIEAIGGRQAYLESLLAVARHRLCAAPLPAALFLGERHLSERVELLLKEVVMSKVRALSHLFVAAGLLLLTGAVASSALPLALPGTSENVSQPAAVAKAKAGAPRLVHKVDPAYPPEAKKDHIEGLVHVDLRLAKDGTVAEAKATDGHPTLVEAALAAVRQWRYEPVLGADKKPVEAKLAITISFRLD